MKALYIVGPTASGKTALSIELAKHYDAEIICADSQTVRRAMDIGTAKPSEGEMQGVPHHMLDVVDPYDRYTLGDYQAGAEGVMHNIYQRGKTPIVVGGTGLYVDALYFGFDRSMVDYADKHDFERLSIEQLQEKITELGYPMPENSLNKRHLVNTLSRQGRVGGAGQPDPGSLIIGINPGRDVLINRINARVDTMFESGFVDEVRGIIEKYGRPPTQFDAIGYRIVLRMLDGEITETEASDLFKVADRQYAKRQMSWFKRNPHIQWFTSPDEAKAYILNTWQK